MKKSGKLLVILVITGCLFLWLTAVSYAVPAWKPAEGIQMAAFSAPASIEMNAEQQGIVVSKTGDVHWVVKQENAYRIYQWNFKTGKSGFVYKSEKPIIGFAYASTQDIYLIRTGETLYYVDPISWKSLRSASFKSVSDSWRDIRVVKDSIYIVNENARYVDIFDLHSLRKKGALDSELSAIDRMYKLDDSTLGFWSNQEGKQIHLFDLFLNQLTKNTRLLADFDSLYATSEAGDHTLGYFDLKHPETFQFFKRYGSFWIEASHSHEQYGDQAAFRFAPIKEKVTGSYSVVNQGADLNNQDIVLAIPSSHYTQLIQHESISQGKIIQDLLGNRYVKIKLENLVRGQEKTGVFYEAVITRWHVFFDVRTLGIQNEPHDVPENKQIYLLDSPIFSLHHRYVEVLFSERFAELFPVQKKMEAIFHFARDKIKNVWDGERDPVPWIIQNRHGGTREHAYFQVAMLRKMGLAARIAIGSVASPTGEPFRLNYSFAEVWFPETGWIPLDPMTKHAEMGVLAERPLVFFFKDQIENQFFGDNDRLSAYLEQDEEGRPKGSYRYWDKAPVKVNWERLSADN